MDAIPADITDWTGWTFAGVQGAAIIFAFLRGWIVPKSTLDMQTEATKRAQEANAENSVALKELREMGHTTIDLVESLKAAEKKRRA